MQVSEDGLDSQGLAFITRRGCIVLPDSQDICDVDCTIIVGILGRFSVQMISGGVIAGGVISGGVISASPTTSVTSIKIMEDPQVLGTG